MESNNIPHTHAELEVLKEAKFSTSYKVKESFNTQTKDVDFSKRIVKSIPNTFMYFDNDQDVLIPGCSTKSLRERGPGSTSDAKIKNVKDHNISMRIGVPQLMDERTMDGHKVQYAESKMLTTTAGNDMLIEYQEGVIDQHSIGFQYKDISLVTADDEEWSKWLSQLINPKDCEAYGYMFVVKEIKQFEWSPVSFGSNKLTPYLGLKTNNKDAMIMKVFERIDLLENQYRNGRQSDETLQDYQLESLQLKQIITELFTKEPSIKDTLLQGRQNSDTRQKDTSLIICTSCMKQFNAPTTDQIKCPGCGQFVTQSGSVIVPFDLGKAINETNFVKF